MREKLVCFFPLWTINPETLPLFPLATGKLRVKFHAPLLGATNCRGLLCIYADYQVLPIQEDKVRPPHIQVMRL